MTVAGPPWWVGGVIYQVYVRSFQDSDGDGYGDLPGLALRLEHLGWLGVDAVWLSPTFPSPNDDWGYDVSDYLGVHRDLGTLEDLDAVVAAASERAIAVLLDLVPNHTSTAHPWFVEARHDRGSERRPFYLWADPAPGGGPPNNWVAATGGPAWELDEASGQYYLHNYLPSQADLNWRNPAVHEAFEEILEHWFRRGIAGFRIDVAHALYKDALLRDNPPAAPGDELYSHGGQRLLYSANRPETHAVYRRWRQLAESYEPARLLLGETWVPDAGRLASYYGSGDELQLAFDFPFLFAPFEPQALAGEVAALLEHLPPGACPVWAGSNHDVSRFPSRWASGDEAAARLALAILLTLPGTAVLYYGDEVAMTDVVVAPEDERDPMHRNASAGKPSRDRARTPMPWEPSPSLGFSRPGVRPWLPYGDAGRNVAAGRRQEGSTLQLCQALVALRHAHLRASPGDYELLELSAQRWSYRSGGLAVHANFGLEELALSLPDGMVPAVLTAPAGRRDGALVLAPRSAAVLAPSG